MTDSEDHPPSLDYRTPVSLSRSDPASTEEIINDELNKLKPRAGGWLFSGLLISLFTFFAALRVELDSHPFPSYAYVRWCERILNALLAGMLFCQFMAFFRSLSRKNHAMAALSIILIFVYCYPWLLVNGNSRVKEGRLTRADTDIQCFRIALESFHVDLGRYPTSQEGLPILITNTGNFPQWTGPYLKNILVDPWDTPYRYTIPGIHNSDDFDLTSAGPDGVFDTSDDLANWKPSPRSASDD